MGKEHMLLHFYVQARPSGAAPYGYENSSYLDRVSAWANHAVSSLSDVTMDEFVEMTQRRAQATLDSTKELFHFLSGDPLPRPQSERPYKEEVKEEKEEKGWTSGFTGLFSGLRGTAKNSTGNNEAPDGTTYS